MKKKLLRIGEAAKFLDISIDTLRRLDNKGKLKSFRFNQEGHRYYNMQDLELFTSDIFKIATDWIANQFPIEPQEPFYVPDSSVFQAKLAKLEKQLKELPGLELEYSLITSMVGEIGNNSFDHNIGSWPDIRGVLFGYDVKKRQIVLADRGQGILTTLKRARPDLSNDKNALFLAFTEKISGRAPEGRGNGLKYVKRIVTQETQNISIKLFFQTGDAELNLKKGDTELNINISPKPFRGCIALINF